MGGRSDISGDPRHRPEPIRRNIVRMFRRLINLVDQLIIAVEVIGDERLKARLTAVHDAIFRDIIKVNSLYVVAEDDV